MFFTKYHCKRLRHALPNKPASQNARRCPSAPVRIRVDELLEVKDVRVDHLGSALLLVQSGNDG